MVTDEEQGLDNRVWKPSSRQEDFLEIPDTVREGFYGGAAGGGKSEILLMLPIAKRWYEHPRWKGILFRRTFPELEKSLILRSESDGYYKGTGAEYNRQLRRWRWPSGAILDFGYAEHENDVRKYDTTEYNYVGWDELTSFTEFQYMYVSFSRARSSVEKLPVVIRSGSNPGNVGHGWVRKRFVEPAPYGTLIKDRKTGLMRIFIQSLPTDNPYLMKADPNYIRGLEMLPEAEKRAKLYGDWWTFSGQVFDDWRMEPFEDEPEHARHVIPAFDIPSYWPIVLASDWGFNAMTWNGWFAAAPTKRAYLCKEYACTNVKISDWAKRVGELSQGMRLVDCVLDPSGFYQTGADKTIAEQVMMHSGLTFRKGDNDRLGGKMLMQEYLRWRPKPPKVIPTGGFDPVRAEQILRWGTRDQYLKYADLFVPELPETNLPRLQVFGTNSLTDNGICPEFIKAIPLCVYNSDGSNLNKEDVAEFSGDDPYDGGRYGIKAVDRYYNLSARDSDRVNKHEQIMANFKVSQDYTALHRQMEKFESEEKVGRRRVRRYHGPSRPRGW